ncbi:hypothetical protein [Paenibacillus sp. 1_12]|uniref:hypothetical protein n=1 Tax=Paenibacillus sp. 1_12 TaxID=1566278 RepID=UPI001160AF94|nr:hypothetical protein [Paenibacillus sp. 1_12]
MKKHEDVCYSICLYVLQCEAMACEAAKAALYNLMKCDSFFVENPHTTSILLRKESLKCALQLMKSKS